MRFEPVVFLSLAPTQAPCAHAWGSFDANAQASDTRASDSRRRASHASGWVHGGGRGRGGTTGRGR